MLYGGYERLKKKRLLENVPTSKVAGVTLGLNEIKGKAIGDPPLQAPLSEKDAVFYMYRIDEHAKNRGSSSKSNWTIDPESDGVESIFDVAHFEGQDNMDSNENWRPLDNGKNHCQFYLEDETGRIRVRPTTKTLLDLDTDRLKVDLLQFLGEPVVDHICGPDDPMYYEKGPRDDKTHSGDKRRFREWIVPHDGEVYVMGPVRVRDDIVEPEMAADPDIVDMDHQFFMSTKGESDLGIRYFRQSRSNYGCAFALVLMTFWIYTVIAFVGEWPGFASPNIFVATGIGVAAWGMAVTALYLKTVYDGLVELRNRADRAWAMLDVELKRRHTLVPRLVDIVESIAGHEAELQKAATKARTTAANTNEQAAQAIDGQTEALGRIFAIAEDYPQIKTDQHFETLMTELSRCEKKIALARQFYNDSIERLNNRVDTIPDRFVAPLARATNKKFLSFDEFETKPIDIDLTDTETKDKQATPV